MIGACVYSRMAAISSTGRAELRVACSTVWRWSAGQRAGSFTDLVRVAHELEPE